MFFKSLKKEILVSTLGLTIATIIIATAIGVFSTQRAGSNAQNVTTETLREQVKEFLTKLTENSAKNQDLVFERIRGEAGSLASYMTNIYDNPIVFHNSYWRFDDRIFKKDGKYLNSESDLSTVFIPNFVVLNAKEKFNIELSSYIDFIAPGILESNPNIVAIYTTDRTGSSRYVPNIVLGNIVPPDFNTLEDFHYKQTTPEENPNREIRWTSLYDDPAKRGLMITVSAPIYTKDGFIGDIGIDVLLNDIAKSIETYNPVEGSYAFLIDKDGSTIAFPDKAYEDILGRSRENDEVRTSLAASSQDFLPILKNMTSGIEGFGAIHNGDEELFVAYAPLPETGFSMAIVVDGETALKAAASLHNEISGSIQNTITNLVVPSGLLIILIASAISVVLITRIVKPIKELTLGAKEVGRGNLDYKIEIESKNEIGILASSFGEMSKNLKKSREEIQTAYEVEKKARVELEELDKAKDQFILTTQHHLRTPLTILKGYLAMLKDDQSLSEESKSSINKVSDSTDTLAKFVNELLQVTELKTNNKERKEKEVV